LAHRLHTTFRADLERTLVIGKEVHSLHGS